MPKRPTPASTTGLPHGDPRRKLKIRRLGEESLRIADFKAREPLLEDEDFEEWEITVKSLLVDLFGSGEFIRRFYGLRFRPISHRMDGHSFWHGNPPQTWSSDLQSAEKILKEAIEELLVEMPGETTLETERDRAPQIVVNVSNSNVFSATAHISFKQLTAALKQLPISETEEAIALEHLKDLKAETEDGKRWPIIAKSLEGIKALGKNVYKEIAVPLIVEFLKREAGLSQSQ